MRKAVCLLPLAFALLAAPAWGKWEELRRSDSQRLSIDPASIKRQGGATKFRYLVDFREKQGDFKTVEYRSLTVAAAINCKARTIALDETVVYPGEEAKGPSAGVMKPERSTFNPIEAGTSDEDLFNRVCKPPAKAAAKPAPQPKEPPKK